MKSLNKSKQEIRNNNDNEKVFFFLNEEVSNGFQVVKTKLRTDD